MTSQGRENLCGLQRVDLELEEETASKIIKKQLLLKSHEKKKSVTYLDYQ